MHERRDLQQTLQLREKEAVILQLREIGHRLGVYESPNVGPLEAPLENSVDVHHFSSLLKGRASLQIFPVET